jgi:sugar lactone lactonase YvrE
MRTRTLTAVLTALVLLVAAAVAVAATWPAQLDLPTGSQPEGIASGKGHELFVGSIPTGAVYRFDARTGKRTVAVPARDGHAAIGLKADHRRRLFVAGGPTGRAYVYDAKSGAELAAFQLAPSDGSAFINDVALTKRAAYFTNSFSSTIYAVSTDLSGFRAIPLPDVPLEPGFNLNGIAATPDGKTLFAVQSNAGRLWKIDPKTGHAVQVAVTGTELTFGDGLLLAGKTLYVVRNQLNKVAVLQLSKKGTEASFVRDITDPAFKVPTTAARLGSKLYVVSAQFGVAEPEKTDYYVTRVKR